MATMRSPSTAIAASWCTVRAASEVTMVASRITIGMAFPLVPLRPGRRAPPPCPTARVPATPASRVARIRPCAATDAIVTAVGPDTRTEHPMRTVIHGGDVIAYYDGGHRLLRGGSVAFEGDRVVFVGRGDAGTADARIDATGKLVIPGLVNLHCHATTEATGRLFADAGRRDFFHTGFLNYQSAPPGVAPMNAREDLDVGNRFALVELLRNGCTTIVELGAVIDATVAFAGAIGIRAYLTPGYRSASYRLGAEGRLEYEWDEAAGTR